MSLIVEQRGAVLVLCINRPERANSLDPQTNAELGAALLDGEARDDVRALVLTGAGERVFCGGMDLRAFAEGSPGAAASASMPRPPGVEQLNERYYPKPVIAAVNGAAMGGGFGLVLACDLVVAAEHATFGTPEVARGLVGVGVSSRAALRLPPAIALELALTGDPIDAHTAHRLGFVNRVVPGPQVLDTAVALATRIAEHPSAAVLAAKDIVYTAAQLFGRIDMPALRARAAHVMNSPEARAGAKAFVERKSTSP